MTEKAITCDHEGCDEWASADDRSGWYMCYPFSIGPQIKSMHWLCPMHATSAFGVTKTLAPTGTTIIDPVQLQRSTPERSTPVDVQQQWKKLQALRETIKRQPESQSPLHDPLMWSIMSGVFAVLALVFSLLRLVR